MTGPAPTHALREAFFLVHVVVDLDAALALAEEHPQVMEIRIDEACFAERVLQPRRRTSGTQPDDASTQDASADEAPAEGDEAAAPGPEEAPLILGHTDYGLLVISGHDRIDRAREAGTDFLPCYLFSKEETRQVAEVRIVPVLPTGEDERRLATRPAPDGRPARRTDDVPPGSATIYRLHP